MKTVNQRKEIKQSWLDSFHEVMKSHSVTAAANNVSAVPSVVSERIKRLEEALGEKLFERCARNGMKPNDAAEIVDEYYLGCRTLRDYMDTCLQERRDMKRGKICIVLPSVYIDVLMEDVLNEFCLTYPRLNMHIEEINPSPQIITNILEDISQIGIVNNYSQFHSNIRCYARAPIPVCLLVSKSHPLADKRRITFSETMRYPLALPPTSFNVWQMIREAERSSPQKMEWTPSFISNSVSARKQFVITGQGGTLLSTFAARREIETGQLIALEIYHPAFTSVESCLIVRQGRPLSPATNQLLRLIVAKSSIFSRNLS
ncbi:LysR family transcriptional regulator [Mycoavidus sp. SF9855]|uniref:LysR family transcriptional regulator n=1 Tax=Mycoavidus sp. SF9855 TaxID=2968475 RepID=UPI00211BFB00|nr:LysR family transcriptional regulator [Mycoavidus sp. SF9855]UUM22108.1 LysR family transcriptional regulator [Mycoavidus sp. SF9855]